MKPVQLLICLLDGQGTNWQTIGRGESLEGVVNTIPAHTGDNILARSWVNSGPGTWVFSSAFGMKGGEEYEISFWYLAPGYPAYSEYDNFEVKIGSSPTPEGMASAFEVFKLIDTRVAEWTLLTQTFTPETDGAYYLAFHCLNPAETGIYICIDDILITGEIYRDCEPVADLTATYTEDCTVELSWTASSGEIDKYEVYENGFLVSTVTTTQCTAYLFNSFENVVWEVLSICKSGIANTTSITQPPCAECPRIDNFFAEYIDPPNDCTANLSWNEPLSLLEGALSYCDPEGEIDAWSSGLANPVERDITFAARFTPLELAQFGVVSGQKITSITIFAAEDIANVTEMSIKIWEGGTAVDEPGDLKVDQMVDPSELESDDVATITLDEAFTIDATKELRIGYRQKWPAEYHDSHIFMVESEITPLKGKGNLMYTCLESNCNWSSFDEGNFYIIAEVEVGDGQVPSWEYDIYRNGELLKEKHTETSYIDNSDIEPLTPRTYTVKLNCLAGGAGAPSSMTLDACDPNNIEIINQSFSIVPNPAKDNIKITAENDFNQVEIVNFLGQIVLSQTNNGNISNVNVSNLSNGVYFIRIISNQATSIQKFVKQ